MTDQEIKEIFILQSRNVRYLKKVQKNLTMDINHYLLKGDTFKITYKTNYYSLLYSLLSEAQFTQILHTPLGFQHTEILKIQKERSIIEKWHLMLELALKKVGDYHIITDLYDKRSKLESILKEYIEKPQKLRNKIAHGQWIHALNSKNTKENEETTNSIKNLNIIEISKWFEIHQYLCFIVRDLIQSPNKGFHNQYWVNYVQLESFLLKSKNWTLENRIADIKRKYQNRDNHIEK